MGDKQIGKFADEAKNSLASRSKIRPCLVFLECPKFSLEASLPLREVRVHATILSARVGDGSAGEVIG